MTAKKQEKMSYPVTPTQLTDVAHSDKVSYPRETRMDKGFQAESVENSLESVSYPPSSKIPEFVSAKKAMLLMGSSWPTIKRHCKEGKFKGAQKILIDGNESWQIPITSLPQHARDKLGTEHRAAAVARAKEISPLPLAIQSSPQTPEETRALFAAYEQAGSAHEERTEKSFAAAHMFNDLVKQGYKIGQAEKTTMDACNISRATLYRIRTATDGHHVSEWMPRLYPKFSNAGRPLAEFTEEAYEFIYGSRSNTSKTALSVILVKARALAPSKGWVIPSDDAVRNRLAKEPRWANIAGREGPKKLEQTQPPVKRDYTGVAVNEIWCSDGHRFDLFCRWPDGTIERLFLIAWCDIRSRAVLGVKVYSNPNAQGVLSAFGMAMHRTGYAPDIAKIDNGMEYAAKSVTGGQANRYRNKVIPGEVIGLLTQVGTTVVWSEPGRGQDKPIESFWNFIIAYFVKLPEFEGAYCGPNTSSKPEGFDPKKYAIPLAEAQAKLEEVLQYFNTQHRHRGQGMDGRTPQEVYTALFDPASRKRVDPMYIERSNHGVTQIKPDRSNVYTLTIPGHGIFRYWSEAIAGLPEAVLNHRHDIYYDLDDPKKGIWVNDGKKFIGKAPLFEDIPFREIGGEKSAAHKKAKNERMKPQRAAVKQLKANATLAPLALPAPVGGVFSAMPVTIEAKRSPPLLQAPEAELSWEETGNPGECRDKETGQLFYPKKATPAPVIQGQNAIDDEEREWQETEEKARLWRLKKNQAANPTN